jgi:hypothetical protein
MQSNGRDIVENKAVILKHLHCSRLCEGPPKRPGIGKMHPLQSRIILKIHGLAKVERKSHNFRDVKMQKRSHHVVENKGSGLGSFSKRTPNEPICGPNEPILQPDATQLRGPEISLYIPDKRQSKGRAASGKMYQGGALRNYLDFRRLHTQVLITPWDFPGSIMPSLRGET